MKEDFTSGELLDNIFILDTDLNEDGEQGLGYAGWWSMQKSRE